MKSDRKILTELPKTGPVGLTNSYRYTAKSCEAYTMQLDRLHFRKEKKIDNFLCMFLAQLSTTPAFR